MHWNFLKKSKRKEFINVNAGDVKIVWIRLSDEWNGNIYFCWVIKKELVSIIIKNKSALNKQKGSAEIRQGRKTQMRPILRIVNILKFSEKRRENNTNKEGIDRNLR